MSAELVSLVLLGLGYLSALFATASAVERGWIPRRLVHHPLIGILALGVYANAWAVIGSLGVAHQRGFGYLAYYLGAAGAFVLAPVLLLPLQRMTRTHQLSSLADLFAFRFRSRWVGTCVTLLSLVAVMPLLAMQVEAMGHAIHRYTDAAPGLLSLHEATGFGYRVEGPGEMDVQGVGKVLYIGDPSLLADIEAGAREAAGEALHITYSMSHSLEIMAAGVNKGTAVSALLGDLGIPATRCLAFGDNLNDLEMLALAGEAQVMANAHPRLAEDLPEARVIGHHAEAAVAQHLRQRFGLDG